MQSRNKATRKLARNMTSGKYSQSAAANTDLYDLWLNSKLPFVDPKTDTGVTSSSSHQLVRDLGAGAEGSIDGDIDSERLAETLMQLSYSEMVSGAVEERL